MRSNIISFALIFCISACSIATQNGRTWGKKDSDDSEKSDQKKPSDDSEGVSGYLSEPEKIVFYNGLAEKVKILAANGTTSIDKLYGTSWVNIWTVDKSELESLSELPAEFKSAELVTAVVFNNDGSFVAEIEKVSSKKILIFSVTDSEKPKKLVPSSISKKMLQFAAFDIGKAPIEASEPWIFKNFCSGGKVLADTQVASEVLDATLVNCRVDEAQVAEIAKALHPCEISSAWERFHRVDLQTQYQSLNNCNWREDRSAGGFNGFYGNDINIPGKIDFATYTTCDVRLKFRFVNQTTISYKDEFILNFYGAVIGASYNPGGDFVEKLFSKEASWVNFVPSVMIGKSLTPNTQRYCLAPMKPEDCKIPASGGSEMVIRVNPKVMRELVEAKRAIYSDQINYGFHLYGDKDDDDCTISNVEVGFEFLGLKK